MAIAVEVETVETEDAAPTVSPFKVSAKTGKTKLLVTFKITAADKVRAWRLRFKPTNRNTGKLLGSRGMVCGTGDRCGSPTARTLNVASPLTTSQEMQESQIASEADGEYEVKGWALSEADGWSS